MAYDKALISSILRQLEQQHDRYEAEAESRRYQLSADIPRLAEIDRELRGTAAKAMRIAFESNNTDAAIEQLKQRNLALQAEKRKLLLDNGYPADYLTVDRQLSHLPRHRLRRQPAVRLRQAPRCRDSKTGFIHPAAR